MTVVVEFPDVEQMLGQYLRPRLTEWHALVDRLEPVADPDHPNRVWKPGYAVVVRDDSGPDISAVLASRRVGVRVIGADYAETRRLAGRVAALLRALPDALILPVADVVVRGPYSLDATGRAEVYLTADLIVVGHSVNL